MIDLLIRGGTVVDGTGKAPYAADVAVENGKIVEVGDLPGAHARRVISAQGKLVTPGFIDIHRHADLAAYRPGFGQLELRQGLTTIVNGNCGLSAAPMRRARRAEIAAYLQPICGEMPNAVSTDTLAAYFAGQPEAPLHTGMLVGAGVLRASAAGYALEHLEDKHYKAIHRAMEQALVDGALGVSLGLGYAPECFYTTQELIRALEPLAGQNIPVTVHMRQEGGDVLGALEEMLTVARALRIPVHISHLKAMGRDNWGTKIPQALSMLEQARQEGLDVGCDVYPYTAGSTQLIHILPPDFLTGGMETVVQRLRDKDARRELAERIRRGDGFDDIAKLAGWDGIRLTSLHCPEDHPYQGKSIAEIAALWGQNPLDSLRSAGAGALRDHHGGLHGHGGGHCDHPAKPSFERHLRLYLSHGRDAPSPGVRHVRASAGALCEGAGRADGGAGGAQDDPEAGSGAVPFRQGRAGGGHGRGHQCVRPGKAAPARHL